MGAALDTRDPLSRERIAGAALAIVDAEGLDALTMRRLAAELRAAPMAAYAHFADKGELLAEVVDAVMGEVDLPEADGRWRKPLRRLALSFRGVLLAHPAVMPAFHAYGARGANALAVLDRAHGILRTAGFPDEHAGRAVETIHAFALGFVSLEIAWASLDPGRRHAQIFALPQSAYPDLTAVMPHVLAVDGEERFRYGLDRILDGLAVARRPT
jgi:TetR/AcrR family tetracycline transcriptional repressor